MGYHWARMVSRTIEVARPALVRIRLDIRRRDSGAHLEMRNDPGRERCHEATPDAFRWRRNILVDEFGNRDAADARSSCALQVHHPFLESQSRTADTRRVGARGRAGIPGQELRS